MMVSNCVFISSQFILLWFQKRKICVPGVVAASLSAIVFARLRQTSLEILLCGLSIFDVLVLSCTLLIYPAMHACGEQEQPLDSLVCHFFWKTALVTFPLSVIAQTGSVWTCVAVTLDRFIAVSYPMRKRVLSTPSTSVAALGIVSIFSFLFKLPAFLEITLDEDGMLVDTPLRQNVTYQKIYMTYLYTVVLVVIPWSIIIILNAIVIRKVRQAYRIQSHMTIQRAGSRREDAERKVTVMSSVMTVLFILCNIPPTFCNSIEAIAPEWRISFRPAIPLSNLLVCVNSASNILIYCVFNAKFRRAVWKLFCCQAPPEHGMKTTHNFAAHSRVSQQNSNPGSPCRSIPKSIGGAQSPLIECHLVVQ